MNDKTRTLVHRISTGLLTLLMLFSAGMYFLDHEMVKDTFTKLGFPTYIIYPLAVLKILGLIAIWTKQSKWLMEWAYAGFFFDFVLAAAAHYMAGDGESAGALVAIVLLIVSHRTLAQPS